MYSMMIIDDEMAIRENLPKAFPFKDYGFKVCGTAANGEEALKKLSEWKPDLIFLDVCMPVLDGLGFLKQLRNSPYKETKVVMLSGFNDFEYARQALRYEVKAYLTKPIDEDELYPLLQEVYDELSQNRKDKTAETIRDDSSYLKKIYNCGQGERGRLQEYMLMHIALLGMDTTFEEQHPEFVLHKCLEQQLEQADYCEVQSRGSIYSFLLRKESLTLYQNDIGLFAKHLIYQLKLVKLECVLLFDRILFEKEEKSIREDYSRHLYQMLSRVFHGDRNYMEYTDSGLCRETTSIKLGDQFLEKLKKGLMDLDRDKLEEVFAELTKEVDSVGLEIEFIQEMNFRMYYLLIEVMASVNGTQCEEPILQPPEWRDYPFFLTFETWKQMQRVQLFEAFSFIERSRKLSNLGVCKSVVEHVHRHFREQISIKEVADQFYMNAAYLGRAFQKATGISFKQYVNDLRMQEAKRLLLQTDKLIYQIAEEVGYTESKYFVSKFTCEVGVSPTCYRKGEYCQKSEQEVYFSE